MLRARQKRHNIAPGACRTELSTKIVLKTRLGACRALFGRGLGQSWTPLGISWPAFGCSWAALDPSWALLGRLLGALGRHLAGLRCLLGAFWLPRTPRASILEGLGTYWDGFWNASEVCFGTPFAAHVSNLRIPSAVVTPCPKRALCCQFSIVVASTGGFLLSAPLPVHQPPEGFIT